MSAERLGSHEAAEIRELPFQEIITKLLALSGDDVFESPQKFLIKGPVTAGGLRQLTQLPYEIGITELNGELILNTGQEQLAAHHGDHESAKRFYTSKVSCHTHTVQTYGLYSNGIELNRPSEGDVENSWLKARLAPGRPSILVHPEGITAFVAPSHLMMQLDDESQRRYEEISMQVNEKKRARKYEGMSRLERELQKIDGIIVEHVDWSDAEKIDGIIEKYINGPIRKNK